MEINIRITGEAGQGVAGAASVLGKSITRSGFFAYSYNDAESRVRGGLNFNHLRVSTGLRRGTTSRADILIALSREGMETYHSLLGKNGVLLALKKWADEPASETPAGSTGKNGERSGPMAAYNLEDLAKEAGSTKVSVTVGVGAVCGLLGIRREVLKEVIKEAFEKKPKVLDANIAAVDAGYSMAEKLDRKDLQLGDAVEGERMWMDGAQAVAGGALAGGVGFMTAYPMSPSTGVVTNLAEWAETLGVTVVQAEDEIAAINMLAGASYGGARSMTATSGGGFALMEEGVSLLGMIECPGVIVMAQRPGPATGLPTRQAQGDLHMVLNAGHGHFPRVVVAPRDFEDCFRVMSRAFDLAEYYQVPVFVLTDQHFMDGQSTVGELDFKGLSLKRHLLSKDQLQSIKTYNRYELTDSGVSPMAPPGASRHVVVVDSDEHDVEGHLTESAQEAQAMVEKRFRKEASLRKGMDDPEYMPLVEGEGCENLVFSWGSTYHTVREALSVLQGSEKSGGVANSQCVAHAHLNWLWPSPVGKLKELVETASKVVVVENNVDGQFVKYLRMITGYEADVLINRMDGRPLLVEDLVEQIGKEVG